MKLTLSILRPSRSNPGRLDSDYYSFPNVTKETWDLVRTHIATTQYQEDMRVELKCE